MGSHTNIKSAPISKHIALSIGLNLSKVAAAAADSKQSFNMCIFLFTVHLVVACKKCVCVYCVSLFSLLSLCKLQVSTTQLACSLSFSVGFAKVRSRAFKLFTFLNKLLSATTLSGLKLLALIRARSHTNERTNQLHLGANDDAQLERTMRTQTAAAAAVFVPPAVWLINFLAIKRTNERTRKKEKKREFSIERAKFKFPRACAVRKVYLRCRLCSVRSAFDAAAQLSCCLSRLLSSLSLSLCLV